MVTSKKVKIFYQIEARDSTSKRRRTQRLHSPCTHWLEMSPILSLVPQGREESVLLHGEDLVSLVTAAAKLRRQQATEDAAFALSA
jgi:hypothetical protein